MKKILILLLIIAMGSIAGGCSQDQPAGKPAKTINIGIMPDVESAPFLIAEKNGYYAKQGVQVKIVPFKSAKDRDSALQSGQLDGVVTDMVAVIFANSGGINLRICAKTDGNIELLAGQDSGITSVQGLQGKSVGLSTNTIMEYSLDRMLENQQTQPGDVNKVAIPQLPTRLEMLQGGKVDAAILPEPLSGLAIQGGARVLSSTDQLGNKAGVIAFTAGSLQSHPGEVQAVMRAYNDAVGYMQAEPLAAYIDFLIQAQGFPAAVKDIIRMPQYTKAEMPSAAIFDDVMNWMMDKQLVKNQYNYNDLVNAEMLR